MGWEEGILWVPLYGTALHLLRLPALKLSSPWSPREEGSVAQSSFRGGRGELQDPQSFCPTLQVLRTPEAPIGD